MNTAIEVEALTKIYTRRHREPGFWRGLRSYFSLRLDEFRAVHDLRFTIERGESVGLIGENGAGKSTTVKMLTGILVPTRGRVTTLGLEPWRERRQLALNIGVVFGQKPQLLWDIPAGESFKLLKAMYRIPAETYRYTYDEAVERLELGPLLKTPVRLLSLGQRMRCDLAAALLHAPAVAFLDEPTIGLDVLVKERVRELLRDMRQRFGTTILLTTHDLKDISTSCERLIVLDRGELLYDGDLDGFRARFARERSVVAELEATPDAADVAALERDLAEHGARPNWETPRRVRVECAHASVAPKITGTLLQRLKVQDLNLQGADIDAVVTQLYRNRECSK
jgi:ABC-2 type transport system ATP-binding protein